MSNRNHAWRLEDEDGNKMGQAPSLGGNIKMYLDGREVGQMQSISFEPIRREPRYVGDSMPLSFSGTIETRTFEVQIEDIVGLVHRAITNYYYRFNEYPKFVTMNEKAYQSYYIKVREIYPGGEGINEIQFLDAQVMCNPRQEEDILVLGDAMQEGLQGRLSRHDQS